MNIDCLKNTALRGAMLVAKGDEVLYRRAYGFRDLANELPNTLDTRFGSASAGKAFVGVAILQLIERGKLDFDTTIGELDLFESKTIDKAITVKQLLTHTSGIPDYFDESVMREYEELWIDFPNYRIRHNSDLLPLFADKPMMYKRGERFQYNNTGYVVLAMIIEKLTGLEFDQYIKENVFAPCGMSLCGYFELDRLPKNCASNYIEEESGAWRTNIYSIDAKGTGAGGAFIAVEDINRFWQGLIDGKLISKELVVEMTKPQAQGDDDGLYGYGLWISPFNGEYLPYFQGCDPGVSFVSLCQMSKRLTVTLVSNYGEDVWQLMEEVKKAL